MKHNSSLVLPIQVRVASWLFTFMALIWIALALFSLADVSSAPRQSNPGILIIIVMMFGNAILFLVFGWALRLQSRLGYLLGIAFLGMNLILTLTDQVGALDLITFLLDAALLAWLLLNRKHFFSGQ